MATKSGQQREAAGDRERASRRAPALLGGADDAEDGQRQAGGRGERAGDVDRAAARGRGGISAGDGEHGERDRDVDVEDPRPGDPLGDHAAEEHAGGAAGGAAAP